MDETDLFKMAGVSTSGVAILLLVYKVLKSMKGKRFVSSCCGRKLDVGIDVQQMTPKDEPIVISVPNPLHKGEVGNR